MGGPRKSRPDIGMYWCSGCEKLLDQELFYKRKNHKGKPVSGKCKKCSSKAATDWALKNPEKAKDAAARHHATEHSKKKQKEWRENNKEYVKEKLYAWRKANPETVNAIARKSRIKNKDRVYYNNRKREILEVTSMPSWANGCEIRRIYDEAKRISKETGVKHHVDHIVPLKGKAVCGLHVENNLQIITAAENLKKFNKFEVSI